MQAGAREVSVFAAASETFSQKNINCSIAESLERMRPVISEAAAHNIKVRGYISCVLGCPFEGPIALSAVQLVAEELLTAGCFEISLGDTIGVGTAKQAREMIRLLGSTIPLDQLAVHYHDTYGQALANILASLDLGIRVVDSSVAGLGGCPYARGATGNVATEDVVYLLQGLGLKTGVDLPALVATGQWISNTLGRDNNSRAGRALFKRQN
jgi:hydroxymethylglutaryl-CoA lyase